MDSFLWGVVVVVVWFLGGGDKSLNFLFWDHGGCLGVFLI